MRAYITVILLLVFANSSCKKETISDTSSQKLQGSWRLLYSNASSNALVARDSQSLEILKFDGNKMLTYSRDTLISKETFLMALKSDHQPYLVADSDPWNPRIFSCNITGNDTLSLRSVHSNVHVGRVYIRVK
ncbi:hypothetical protein [Chitinophaga sp. S165]|uniref:hypothetical protein n=1 Tax=Chitinophaga sp. S165 TaxID=2135462 RepID=UPI000D71B1FA|nr:hypothetical protein [Chitinophaga sp. S165]PWV48360.1 hypothetical protein C7475_107269 [Chitinophaga sp. S165]